MTDEAAIEALEQRFVAAFRLKDVAQIMTCFSPSIVVFDLSTPRQHAGHAAYAADWAGMFAHVAGDLAVELEDRTLTTNGSDLAFGHMIVHVSGRKLDGGTIEHRARVTHVYEKAGGSWRIVHEHISVPIDMATGQPDFQSRR